MELTAKEMQAKDYICLALDMEDEKAILEAVEELHDLVGFYKIHTGFTANGPKIIEEIKKRGGKVFLDLKFHDIPNTVASYARTATRFGVDIFNLHASGGSEMMIAAGKAAQEEAERLGIECPKIIAVTILTSLDEQNLNNELHIPGKLEDQVLRLAQLTEQSGLDGIVCSAADLCSVKNQLPEDFMFITPGVKGISTEAGTDQKRVFTPGNAVQDGSSMLVIGRAIMKASDRRKAAYEILQDIAKVL